MPCLLCPVSVSHGLQRFSSFATSSKALDYSLHGPHLHPPSATRGRVHTPASLSSPAPGRLPGWSRTPRHDNPCSPSSVSIWDRHGLLHRWAACNPVVCEKMWGALDVRGARSVPGARDSWSRIRNFACGSCDHTVGDANCPLWAALSMLEAPFLYCPLSPSEPPPAFVSARRLCSSWSWRGRNARRSLLCAPLFCLRL